MYVSCLRCHKTIKGAEAYSLWAHVESKRCYPDNAIKGWRQQAKEREQKAQIEEAHRASAKEAARKMQKGRDQGPVPPIYPANPPPRKPTEIIELTGHERLEEITTFETRRPKEVKSRVVNPLDDEAGVGSVGERSNPIRLNPRAHAGFSSGWGTWASSPESSHRSCQECTQCSPELETGA